MFCPKCGTKIENNTKEVPDNSWSPIIWECPECGTQIKEYPGDFQPASYDIFFK